MPGKYFRFLFLLFSAVLLTLGAAGCLFGFGQQSYVEVKYFDLDTPPRVKLQNAQIKILPLNSTEPVKFKMVYCNADCEMIMDDYNKWVQPPALLLTRYLQGAFEQQGISRESSELVFSGEIFRFRIDLRNSTASLGVNYAVTSQPDGTVRQLYRNSVVFTCKFKKQGPQYFAAAMSECARQLVFAVERDIKNLDNVQSVSEKK
ncbi:MAG: hypothetical protein PHV59_01060 [Victivallales bacterium]|nr:hypothetical protein [Victivallales bacterium]